MGPTKVMWEDDDRVTAPITWRSKHPKSPAPWCLTAERTRRKPTHIAVCNAKMPLKGDFKPHWDSKPIFGGVPGNSTGALSKKMPPELGTHSSQPTRVQPAELKGFDLA